MGNKVFLYLFVCVLASGTALSSLCGSQTIKDFNSIVQQKGQKVQQGIQIDPVKIAFATPLKQVSDYWRRSIDSFKGRMDEIGLDYVIKEFSTRVDEHRRLQECIQSALETDPDYLVLTPNDPGDKAVISRLLARSSVKIIVQNVTVPDDDWKENPPFMYVGFDHTVGAKLLAHEYIEHFKGRGDVEYAMLYHLQGNQVSRLRGDFFNEIINNQTDFKLVAEYYTGGSRKKARDAAFKILDAHPDVDFIHACATDIAFGVMDALKERGLTGKVLVNGWGGGANELKSLLSGELDFTVMRMNDDNGAAMAEAVRLNVESKLKAKPVLFSGKMVIVRQGIRKVDLLKFEKQAFRYSGNL